VPATTWDKDDMLRRYRIFPAITDKDTFSFEDENFMLMQMAVKRRMTSRRYLEHSHRKVIRTIGL
jgi:hypothetical protein